MLKALICAGALLASGAASACFLSGEQTSGLNKICYYNCVSGTRAITVNAVSLCPLSLSQAPKLDPLADTTLVAQSVGTDKNGCHRTKAGIAIDS